MWETLSYLDKLRVLASQSTVMVELLAEDTGLVEMIRRGDSKSECLAYINENF